MKVLAAVLKVDPTCVSRCVAVVERQLGRDKMLRAEVRRLQNIIISCLNIPLGISSGDDAMRALLVDFVILFLCARFSASVFAF